MKAIFKTFESGAGDCIFIILKDETDGSSHHIMVDCNVLTSDIKCFIREELKLRIDTLIVTHIDADHVNGVTKIMQTPEFAVLQIGQILFNGFQPQTDNVKTLDIEIKKKLDIVAESLPPVVNEDNHKTSGIDAACLITEINKHPEWKAVWRKEPLLAGESITLGNDAKWGYLKFLSPTQTALDELLKKVKLEYAGKLGLAPPDGDFQDQDKYFEVLLRLSNLRKRPNPKKKIGSIIINKNLMERYAKIDVNENNVTPENKASLAFYWEATHSTKRILMMGDAVSSQVLSQLNEIHQEEIWFEVIKVSHHGSKNNTSVDLCAKVDSIHFFITGGKEQEGPHIETIAKIATKSLQEEKSHRVLHYNHTHSLWSELKNGNVKNILNEYNLKTITDNTHEFEY
ncbi:MAG: MBL fold metallo-hydrolase [Bacteroides sp.]|uniref:MBL fold metallo-hydrolase n=1 Tax=Bacteroides sp. TaxID=29523 RepID=UPI002FCA3341